MQWSWYDRMESSSQPSTEGPVRSGVQYRRGAVLVSVLVQFGLDGFRTGPELDLGGVKRREVSRRPPRGARCRIGVRGDCGRVWVEGLKPRASAATSGERTVSAGRRWSETVAHASARRETSYGWPPGSETRRDRVTKAARECGTLRTRGNKQGKAKTRRRRGFRAGVTEERERKVESGTFATARAGANANGPGKGKSNETRQNENGEDKTERETMPSETARRGNDKSARAGGRSQEERNAETIETSKVKGSKDRAYENKEIETRRRTTIRVLPPNPYGDLVISDGVLRVAGDSRRLKGMGDATKDREGLTKDGMMRDLSTSGLRAICEGVGVDGSPWRREARVSKGGRDSGWGECERRNGGVKMVKPLRTRIQNAT
ncbi:hypothetical protein EDB89DRAFT_2249799 [Lactarius sanguifluus]|nr:hypothetical protein EDB89DRAFT_2249799 [Lactarius sanguifluus]